MKYLLSFLVFLSAFALPVQAKIKVVSKDPYLGAIVVDGNSGDVLMAVNADEKGYPASVLKLMDLLIILEQVRAGRVSLQDQVTVSAAASKIGGSQVWLKEKEVFTVDELLYALMIQSANDAAMALAEHVAGSKEGFIDLMNKRAKALGMNSTYFTSVHGLPPAPGSGVDPDTTTARDLSLLCLELLKYPEVFTYTGTRMRGFRNNTVEMVNHNRLLTSVRGCDGFKTGYIAAAGFSIALTAQRDGKRVIAIVLGSKDRKVRDAKAAELIEKGFLALPETPAAPAPVVAKPPAPAPAPALKNAPTDEELDETGPTEDVEASGAEKPHSCRKALYIGILIGLGIAALFGFLRGLLGGRRD
jgi:D-alanyl-D-alanine carboxypeptidase (penicillin-binding protein 5/6)